MTRYVLASRRAGKFSESEKRSARAAADRALDVLSPNVRMLGRLDPADADARQVAVFDAEPAEVQARAAEFGPDVMVEVENLHFPASLVRPLDVARSRARLGVSAVLAGAGATLALTVQDEDGTPVPHATVILVLRAALGTTSEQTGETDDDGRVSFSFSSFWTPAAAIVVPAGGHWSMVSRGPTDGTVVVAPRLPSLGGFPWWHQKLGIVRTGAGAGIKVGVADTGVGPHASLAHVTRIGAFIDGQHDTTATATDDVDSHGTHVCGTIGSRPDEGHDDHPVGVANGVDLFAARIFPGPDSGANQGDIANAIDALSRDSAVDLINLSIGSAQGSPIIRDAIEDALERGTLCVCAAGNSAGPVEFPGGFDESVAIAALGVEGWGPPGSLASLRLPTEPDKFGADGLYLANFSCFGPEIDAAAPGVGIIASVPERFGLQSPLSSMDGTSMASPAACAALAAALANDEVYQALPRDTTRSARARQVLREVSRDVGLAAIHQGAGVPQG